MCPCITTSTSLASQYTTCGQHCHHEQKQACMKTKSYLLCGSESLQLTWCSQGQQRCEALCMSVAADAAPAGDSIPAERASATTEAIDAACDMQGTRSEPWSGASLIYCWRRPQCTSEALGDRHDSEHVGKKTSKAR